MCFVKTYSNYIINLDANDVNILTKVFASIQWTLRCDVHALATWWQFKPLMVTSSNRDSESN